MTDRKKSALCGMVALGRMLFWTLFGLLTEGDALRNIFIQINDETSTSLRGACDEAIQRESPGKPLR